MNPNTIADAKSLLEATQQNVMSQFFEAVTEGMYYHICPYVHEHCPELRDLTSKGFGPDKEAHLADALMECKTFSERQGFLVVLCPEEEANKAVEPSRLGWIYFPYSGEFSLVAVADDCYPIPFGPRYKAEYIPEERWRALQEFGSLR